MKNGLLKNGLLGDVASRLASQVQQSGVRPTAIQLARQARSMVWLDESHIWYELTFADASPDFPLGDDFVFCRGDQRDVERFARIPPVTSHYVRARLAAGDDLWYARRGNDVAFFCWTLRGTAPTVASTRGGVPLPPDTVNLEDSTAVPAFRRSAVGLGTIAHLCNALRAEGITRMVTKVSADNAPAQRWVVKLGFVEVAVATVSRRGPRMTRTVTSRPGHDDSWLVGGLKD